MKRLFEFTLPQEEIVKETKTKTNKKGEEISTTKEVKKLVDKKYFLRKPTRKLFDEAELFYGVELSAGIKAGLLTRALLQKRFQNDGGVLGDKEREEWSTLYSELFDKQLEYQQLATIKAEDMTPDQSAQYKYCKTFITDARKKIQEFELQQSSLYDQTAENRARNRTILWWVLQMAHYETEDHQDGSPFFGNGSYEDRLAIYDTMEEEDEDYTLSVINKFFYYVSFWYVSKTSDPKQFEDLIKFAESEDELPTEVEMGEGEEAEKEEAEKPEENTEESNGGSEESPSSSEEGE